MAGEIKVLEFSEGVSVSNPLGGAAGGSGTGEVNFITNNNGASDLNQSQTDGVGDWVDSGTGTTSSIETASGNIPRYPFQDTGIKITNDGSGTAYTRCRFRVPPADRGKKLKIEWAQKQSNTATGDFTIELYNYSDNYSTGEAQLTLSGSADIPAQDGVYYNEFDADSREYYELRIVRAAGDASDFLVLNDVVVGPGKLHSGAVVTAWESFTPVWSRTSGTLTPDASPASSRYYKRRVGSNMEICFHFRQNSAGAATGSGGYLLEIPGGLNIDQTVCNIGGISPSSDVGTCQMSDSSTNSHGTVMTQTANELAFFGGSGGTGGTGQTTLGNHGSNFLITDANFALSFFATVPIAEWSGSGVLNTIVQDNLTEWTLEDTLILTNAISSGSFALTNGWWKRVGDSMEFVGEIHMGSTGSGSAGDLEVDLPSGYTIDTSKTGALAVRNSIGIMNWFDATGSLRNTLHAFPATATSIKFIKQGESGNFQGSSLAASDQLGFRVVVPITEWAGSQSSLVGFSVAANGNAGLVAPRSGDTTQDVVSGTYTPTFTLTNASGGTARSCKWIRIGNIVSVYGSIDSLTVTTSGQDVDIEITSLPINRTSNFSTSYDAAGTAVLGRNSGSGKDASVILSVPATTIVRIRTEGTSIASLATAVYSYFQFSYEV